MGPRACSPTASCAPATGTARRRRQRSSRRIPKSSPSTPAQPATYSPPATASASKFRAATSRDSIATRILVRRSARAPNCGARARPSSTMRKGRRGSCSRSFRDEHVGAFLAGRGVQPGDAPGPVPVRLSGWLALALTVVAASGCGRQRPGRPTRFSGAPVILISIDTLRADHLPAYGYRAGRTPALDRLAQAGVVFDDVYSQSPLTLPSHTSLLSGRLPLHHGVRDNIGYTVAADERTLAARFKAAGYTTGAAVSSYVLRHQTGISRGFDFFDDKFTIAGTGESLSETQRDGGQTADALADWIDAHAGDRL